MCNAKTCQLFLFDRFFVFKWSLFYSVFIRLVLQLAYALHNGHYSKEFTNNFLLTLFNKKAPHSEAFQQSTINDKRIPVSSGILYPVCNPQKVCMMYQSMLFDASHDVLLAWCHPQTQQYPSASLQLHLLLFFSWNYF